MSLLYERMKEKEEEAKQAEEETRAFQILNGIEKSSKADPRFRAAYEDLRESIIRYNDFLHTQEVVMRSSERISREEAEESDTFRKAVHDALIDRLNFLSRLWAASGKEPDWRKAWGPIGSQAERDAITGWVQRIAPFLKQQKQLEELEEEERRTKKKTA